MLLTGKKSTKTLILQIFVQSLQMFFKSTSIFKKYMYLYLTELLFYSILLPPRCRKIQFFYGIFKVIFVNTVENHQITEKDYKCTTTKKHETMKWKVLIAVVIVMQFLSCFFSSLLEQLHYTQCFSMHSHLFHKYAYWVALHALRVGDESTSKYLASHCSTGELVFMVGKWFSHH